MWQSMKHLWDLGLCDKQGQNVLSPELFTFHKKLSGEVYMCIERIGREGVTLWFLGWKRRNSDILLGDCGKQVISC